MILPPSQAPSRAGRAPADVLFHLHRAWRSPIDSVAMTRRSGLWRDVLLVLAVLVGVVLVRNVVLPALGVPT